MRWKRLAQALIRVLVVESQSNHAANDKKEI
jgi:hypothetical protein